MLKSIRNEQICKSERGQRGKDWRGTEREGKVLCINAKMQHSLMIMG